VENLLHVVILIGNHPERNEVTAKRPVRKNLICHHYARSFVSLRMTEKNQIALVFRVFRKLRKDRKDRKLRKRFRTYRMFANLVAGWSRG
jgi:hypothetical protein